MGRRSRKKFNYYKFLLRTKDTLTTADMEGLKRSIWLYLGNIPITDIHANKALNAGSTKFEEVIRC